MRSILIFFISLILLAACKDGSANKEQKEKEELTATDIMEKAHQKAGGDFWKRPESLTLKGYGLFYENGTPLKNETHNMWRVFEDEKSDAHKANGKVRIESFRNGKPFFVVTYDGQNTYDLRGKQEASAADKRWASNFGYGVIRHALDEGYILRKEVDDTINSQAVYRIKVIDKNKGETFFGIAKDDFKIVKVAFNTPRGWHERIYSNFFEKKQYSWLQSGRVQLYYNKKIANEIFWEDFEVNEQLPDSLFVLNRDEYEK